MAKGNTNNKLQAYFDAHIAPTLERYNRGNFKICKIPVGMNARRMGELGKMVHDRFDQHVHCNGRKGTIVVRKDTKRGVIAINLDGSVCETRGRKDRNRPRTLARC